MTLRPTTRSISASRVQLSQLMMPEHANLHGNVHGGWIMKLVDEAGALAATKHAGTRVVTVAIDQMIFHQPIRIGDLVTLQACVNFVHRTSMEVEVQVVAENPIIGEQIRTNTAYLVYVALGDDGKPAPVPALTAETSDDQARIRAGRERQERRLTQRQRQSDRSDPTPS